MCKECRIRGSICIDQEHGLRVTNPSTTPNGEQAYSLRERVTRLESILEGMLKKELDQSGARASLETSSPSTLGQETGQGLCSHSSLAYACYFSNHSLKRPRC